MKLTTARLKKMIRQELKEMYDPNSEVDWQAVDAEQARKEEAGLMKYMIKDASGERSVSKKEWEALKAELYAKHGMENVMLYFGDDFETGERDVVRGIDVGATENPREW